MNKLALIQMSMERRNAILDWVHDNGTVLENVRDVVFDEDDNLVEVHWLEMRPQMMYWTPDVGRRMIND